MATQKAHLQAAPQKLLYSWYMYIHLLCPDVKREFRFVIELGSDLVGNIRKAWRSRTTCAAGNGVVEERNWILDESSATLTIWSLSNAFTSAFNELDAIPQFKATAKAERCHVLSLFS